jgi:hypothetical protein
VGKRIAIRNPLKRKWRRRLSKLHARQNDDAFRMFGYLLLARIATTSPLERLQFPWRALKRT